ncbi:Armadillo [Cynara cardunculus var. scolymus]|uniref:Armadillo n=1 Tax=Cynara cardunculus var. scolymus TaxID=59895 RepID=A0A103Y9M4_CYNCS|nr:Armadillo [Cynara cardunculus var. scolymus]
MDPSNNVRRERAGKTHTHRRPSGRPEFQRTNLLSLTVSITVTRNFVHACAHSSYRAGLFYLTDMHDLESRTAELMASGARMLNNSHTSTSHHLLLLELLAVEVLPPFALKHRLLLLPDALLPPTLGLTLALATKTQLKRLKLKKNNWSSDSHRFDEVFTESASQKRVYEAVAKPVVEGVLNGYNGTIMAYGQTGTGKTYTLGQLGKDDASERGIMVRALEDIIASASPASDSVEISYLQIYMECVQDLLAPEKVNIPIVEDPKKGEVSVPGAAIVKIQNVDHFLHLLQIGEANRHAANTKMNTESSRSHAILMVSVTRSVDDKEENNTSSPGKDDKSVLVGGHVIPTIRKSKLLIVDLAGQHSHFLGMHKHIIPVGNYVLVVNAAGSEGHLVEETKFINLSLSSLGKCINALAENSPHIPTRDSKLTRLLRDSFGGSARTSLIVTIGQSSRHHTETSSTIMFGQRNLNIHISAPYYPPYNLLLEQAMKVVNFVKLKEEFDYESLCRKLENQIDILTEEIDRQQKSRADNTIRLENNLRECQNSFEEAEKALLARCELLDKDKSRLESEIKDILKELNCQKDHNDLVCQEVESLQRSLKRCELIEKEKVHLESEMKDVLEELDFQKNQNNLMHDEIARLELGLEHNKQYQVETSAYQKVLADTTQMYEKKIAELMSNLDDERDRSSGVEEQLDSIKNILTDHQKSMEQHQIERSTYQKALAETTQMYEQKITELVMQLEDEHARCIGLEEQVISLKKASSNRQISLQIQGQEEIGALKMELQQMSQLREAALDELQLVKKEQKNLSSEKARLSDELRTVREALSLEEKRRKAVEKELSSIKNAVPESEDEFEDKRPSMKENNAGGTTIGTPFGLHNSNKSRESNSFQRTTIAKICEEGKFVLGLQKILALLQSSDLDVQTHAVKVVANLAAEDINQEKIVQEGGLDALLILLRTSQNTTLLRVASGAIANLAMNELNQGLIMSKGGAALLAHTASKTDDPQTLRMVAGAIANLCGNEKLHMLLTEQGGIKALLGMVRSGNHDVIAQVARGMANFAKCESRAITQGHKKGRSLLMDDGVLSWLLGNSNTASISTRRHIELALCHLAQNEDNTRDFVSSGGVKQVARITVESSREDIRNLANKILRLNRTFQAEVQNE